MDVILEEHDGAADREITHNKPTLAHSNRNTDESISSSALAPSSSSSSSFFFLFFFFN